jgi:hypothetical protein
MNKSLLAVLNDSERLLVAETEPKELAKLDEDEVVELHVRVRRARNKYVGQYRRAAGARVAEQGGRGKARPKNQRAALKAEAFEEVLSRVSRRLAVLSKESAAVLKVERLEAARAAKAGEKPSTAKRSTTSSTAQKGRSVTARSRGDRDLRSPVREKNRGGTRALGDRRQAKKDNRSR